MNNPFKKIFDYLNIFDIFQEKITFKDKIIEKHSKIRDGCLGFIFSFIGFIYICFLLD